MRKLVPVYSFNSVGKKVVSCYLNPDFIISLTPDRRRVKQKDGSEDWHTCVVILYQRFPTRPHVQHWQGAQALSPYETTIVTYQSIETFGEQEKE